MGYHHKQSEAEAEAAAGGEVVQSSPKPTSRFLTPEMAVNLSWIANIFLTLAKVCRI